MKREDFLNNVKDKGKPLIIAFNLFCICLVVLLTVGLIQNVLGTNLLGIFFSCLALLILFVLAGKIFFSVNYSGVLKEIKLSKCDFLDNLRITIFFSSVCALITIFIYHISFMANPNKTKSIVYLIESIVDDNTYTKSGLDYVPSLIIFAIGVAAEEVFFRYTAYRIFVKKKEDVKIFIILNSIVFAFYHDLSFSPRFFATLIMSIFLSIIYVMTKSVVYSFISHILWNGSTLLYGFFIEDFKYINTSIFTVESMISGIIIISLLVLLMIYSYFKRGHILSSNIRSKMQGVKSIV